MLTPLLFSLPVFGLLFWCVERPYRDPNRPRRSGRDWRLDLSYWFFTPLVSKPLTHFVVALIVFTGAALMGVRLNAETGVAPLVAGSPISSLPSAVQALLILVLSDFLGYWAHRTTHQGWLWRLHAIHHSPRRLDWLSAVRLHPLNSVLMRTIQAAPLLLLGFNPLLLAGVAPLLGLYALLLHARVPWSFGPLGYVIASPVFHRWHHSSTVIGRNFAGLLPVWDILFGTFYLPRGVLPEAVGVEGLVLPQRLSGQLWAPWNRTLWDAPQQKERPQ
ncbi:MAG: sterol desaturase family protein [Myxococcota bacterium]